MDKDNNQTIIVKGGKVYAFFKRSFDIFFSLFFILLTALPMIVIAIVVKCTSKGPAIYVSKRIGKNGRVFNFYKFRSMRDGADEELKDMLHKKPN